MGNVTGRDEEEEAAERGSGGGGAAGEDDDDDDYPSARSSERGLPPYGDCFPDSVGGSPPRNPGRPRSPRMFAPQTPLPPLERAADVPPVFNQLLMNEELDTLDGPPKKEIPALLLWTLGGTNVLVEGSWDNWKMRRPLQKSGKDHSILLALPSGIYHYRFIVDGQRRHVPELPCDADEAGNLVNLLDVNDYVPENIKSVSEFEPPPSPDSSYGWIAPDVKDLAKDPPALPPQLYLGILGAQNSNAASPPKPHHVVLNHLFMEKGWGSQPLVAVGLTHRFQSKYVTIVLYKPVER